MTTAWHKLAAAAAALTLVVACSSDPETEATDTPAGSSVSLPGVPPKPDQATSDAYIAALVAINPGIVYRGTGTDGDVETAISRGRSQCSTIYETTDRARHLETTAMRFTSPDAPNGWDSATVERILDVVHLHLCPDF